MLRDTLPVALRGLSALAPVMLLVMGSAGCRVTFLRLMCPPPKWGISAFAAIVSSAIPSVAAFTFLDKKTCHNLGSQAMAVLR